jgi:hypothetical protein
VGVHGEAASPKSAYEASRQDQIRFHAGLEYVRQWSI